MTEINQLLIWSKSSGVNWLPSKTPMKTTMLCLSMNGKRTGTPETAAIVTKTIAPNIQGKGIFMIAKMKPPTVPIRIAMKTVIILLFFIKTCV